MFVAELTSQPAVTRFIVSACSAISRILPPSFRRRRGSPAIADVVMHGLPVSEIYCYGITNNDIIYIFIRHEGSTKQAVEQKTHKQILQ